MANQSLWDLKEIHEDNSSHRRAWTVRGAEIDQQ